MQKRRTICLALPEGALPVEFRLFSAGEVRTEKGTFLFDEEAQKLVSRGIKRRKAELMMDYNHASLDPKPLDPALSGRAAGWYDVEFRAGELWAVNVRWTQTAADGIRSKEWRYYSPAFLDDPKTGRIVDFINCALTNLPATHDLTPLVAASKEASTMTDEEKTLAKLEEKLKKLEAEGKGKDEVIARLEQKIEELEAEAKETKAKLADAEKGLENDEGQQLEGDEAKKASRLIAAARQVTGRQDLAEVEGALRALAQSHDQVQRLSSRVAELEAQRTNDEITSLVDEAVRAGKVTPAKRDEFIQLGRENRKALETTLSMLVPIVDPRPLEAPKVDPSTVVLSREDEEIIRRNGIDRDKFIAARKRQIELGLVRQ